MVKSEVVYKKIWYLPTYLQDKRSEKCTLIWHLYQIRVTPKKNVILVNTLDAREFDNENEMAQFIETNKAKELSSNADGKPKHVPQEVMDLKARYVKRYRSVTSN